MKIDPPSHPFATMTEDFLLRQAAAELVVIEQSHTQAVDPQIALSTSLWNWFSEYGRQPSPPGLVAMASLASDYLSSRSTSADELFDLARAAVKEPVQ